MITARVNLTFNKREMRRELARAAKRVVDEATEEIAKRAKILAPQDSGDLRKSIQSEASRMVRPTRATGRVIALARYAVWQHEGTGIYGPFKRRIEPIHARALRFHWKKVGAVVFFKSVKGTPPTKYLTRATDEILPSPPWRVEYETTIR